MGIIQEIQAMTTLQQFQVGALSATVVFSITAIVAAAIARNHWKETREANISAVKQAKASFLLDLDSRFEGEQMFETREALLEMRDTLTIKISGSHQLLDDHHRTQKLNIEFHKELEKLRTSARPKYTTLMRFCGFFETVGLMVKLGYVGREDMIDLFKGPILAIDTCYRFHISERQKEMGVPDGLYKHALFLADETLKSNR